MRTWLLCAASGAAAGLALVVFMTDFERATWSPAKWWTDALMMFLPCVANATLAVLVYRRAIRNEWLMPIMLVPLAPVIRFGFFPKSFVLFIPALVVWLAGIVGVFVASLCETAVSSAAD